jgi:hypothetical protein
MAATPNIGSVDAYLTAHRVFRARCTAFDGEVTEDALEAMKQAEADAKAAYARLSPEDQRQARQLYQDEVERS